MHVLFRPFDLKSHHHCNILILSMSLRMGIAYAEESLCCLLQIVPKKADVKMSCCPRLTVVVVDAEMRGGGELRWQWSFSL